MAIEWHGKTNSSYGNYFIKFVDQSYEYFIRKSDYIKRLAELQA